MSLLPYASLEDLGAYLGAEVPADSSRMLARAIEAVDAALKSAVYTVDVDGNPSDATVVAAFKRATCQQVEWWISTGDEYDQANQYSSFSIEGISVTRAVGIGAPSLCDRARKTLEVAKVLPGTVTAT